MDPFRRKTDGIFITPLGVVFGPVVLECPRKGSLLI
jgi:hypothetical protein